MRLFEWWRRGSPGLIRDLEGIVFASVDELETARIDRYRTCRGAASSDQIDAILDLLLDPSADEDLREDALCEGLWDLLVHQYTLYSVTPIALYRLLRRTDSTLRSRIRDAERFVEVCAGSGSGGIWLTAEEVRANRQGSLPIFSIEEILDRFA